MNELKLELSWESAGYFLNEGKIPLFGPFATEFLAMDFLRQINEVLERVELEKWRDDEPDDEEMYLVAWKGSLKDGDIWPAKNHYYALVMWYSDTGWDYNAFPDFYSKVDIIAWQKLPPYFEGKL